MRKIFYEIIQGIIFVVVFLGCALLLEGTVNIAEKSITALLAYVISRVFLHFVIKLRKNEEK